MFGYKQQGILPSFDNPSVNLAFAEADRQKTRNEHKRVFNVGSHILPPLSVGSKVLVQHPITKRWSHRAVISKILDSGRSYDIQFLDGRYTRRNQSFLRPFSYADSVKTALPSKNVHHPPVSYTHLTLPTIYSV